MIGRKLTQSLTWSDGRSGSKSKSKFDSDSDDEDLEEEAHAQALEVRIDMEDMEERMWEKRAFMNRRNDSTLKQQLDTTRGSKEVRTKIVEDFIAKVSGTKSRYVRSQEALKVLVFYDGKQNEFMELKRDELLALARRAVPNSKTLRKLHESETDLFREREFSGTIRHRDIRLLEANFSFSQDPVVMVRRHCIIVVLPPVRCLIVYNSVFVMIPDGDDYILETFLSHMNGKEDMFDGEEPFEIDALEAAFITVSSVLDKELDEIRPKVLNMLEETKHITPVSLNVLREVKSELTQLVDKIQGIQNAFSEILAADSDMALMNLTAVRNDPKRYAEENEVLWQGDHEEVELLLENYLQAVDGVYGQAKSLERKLESTTSVLMIRLDSARNNLLRLDLFVSVCYWSCWCWRACCRDFRDEPELTCATSGALVWSVASVLIFLFSVVTVASYRLIRQSGWSLA